MLSRIAMVLLAVTVTAAAQCSAACLFSLCEHSGKKHPVGVAGCHQETPPAGTHQSGAPCAHKICVSGEGRQSAPFVADNGVALPAGIGDAPAAPDGPAPAASLEDRSPPLLLHPATKTILRI